MQVQTGLDRGFKDKKFLSFLQNISVNVLGRNPSKGAATSLNCAVNPALNSQQHFYYDSCRPKLPSADSRNEQFQEQLWKRSCEFMKDHLSRETWEKYGPKAEEQATNTEGGDSPKPEGEHTPKPDGEDTPKPEGEDAPKLEGKDVPMTEKCVPKPEGDVSKPEGDVPKPEGIELPKTEEDLHKGTEESEQVDH